MKVRTPTAVKSGKFKDGDYGSPRSTRDRRLRARPLPPLSPEPPRRRPADIEGCILIHRLKQRGWDCYQSMPRYNLHLLRCPKFGGRHCLLVYRDGRWQLIRAKRSSGR